MKKLSKSKRTYHCHYAPPDSASEIRRKLHISKSEASKILKRLDKKEITHQLGISCLVYE